MAEIQQTEQSCKIIERVLEKGKKEISIYIEDFDDYSYYIYAINVLRNATPQDTIILVINSGGGSVYILQAFLSAIEASQAENIVADIVGEACSAAAILALACDDIVTHYLSVMLIHSVKLGLWGKLQDTKDYYNINEILQNRIAKEFYKEFLTDDEIVSVMEGKELWLTSDEIDERWQNVMKRKKEKQDKIIQDLEKQQEEGVIKYLEDRGYKIEKVEED